MSELHRSPMKTPFRDALMHLVAAQVVVDARLRAVEELAARAAGHLPESMLDDLSPELFLAKKKKDFLESLLPYFDDEVRAFIDDELKNSDGIEDSIRIFRKFLREERGDDEG